MEKKNAVVNGESGAHISLVAKRLYHKYTPNL